MAQLQNIIDDIQFHIQSDFCELNDELASLAREYAAMCREANARLRRCGEYLKQGLRSEAIQIAETEPNLLDQIAMLDFPDRAQWDEIVALYELARAEPIQHHLAEALNESYLEQEPLLAILDQHRLLALARAPLNQRLRVLRKIADLDELSLHWDEDIRKMEKARFLEIEELLANHKKHHNSHPPEEILQELSDAEWREPVPVPLLKQARQLATHSVVTAARHKLQNIEVELSAAFAELNLDKARQLREQWQQHVGQAKLPAEHELWEQVAPVLGWISDEEQFEARQREFDRAVSALEIALSDDSSTYQDLLQLHHDAARFDRDLPESLERHFENRIHALKIGDDRRRKLVITASVSVVTILLVSFVFLIRSQLRNQELTRIVQAVDEMIEKGELTNAQALIDQNQHLAGSERWLNLELQLKEAEAEERKRSGRVQELLSEAKHAESYNVAMAALKQAREQAVETEQKLAIVELENEWEEKHKSRIAAIEENFEQRLQAVVDNLQKLSGVIEAEDQLQKLVQLQEETRTLLAGLKNEQAEIRSELGSQVNLLASRFNNLDKLATLRKQKSESLEQLTSLTSALSSQNDHRKTFDEYRQALKSYAVLDPEERRAKDFVRVAEELHHWESILEWNRMQSQWKNDLPHTAQEAQLRIEAISKYKMEHSRSPVSSRIDRYLEYLEPISRIGDKDVSGEESLIQELNALFSSPIFEDIYYVKLKNGYVFYLETQEAYQSEQENNVKYISDMAGTVKFKSRKVPAGEFEFLKSKPAPQTEIAKIVKTMIQLRGTGDRENWRILIQGIVQEILTKQDLDDLFKYYLLKQVLQIGAEGSQFMKDAFEAHLDRLEDDRINLLVKWMDPIENSEADNSRNRAKIVIEQSVKGLDETWKKLEQTESQLPSNIDLASYQPIGWLHRKKFGDVEVKTHWKPELSTNARLMVVAASETGSANLETIGTVEGQQWIINTNLQSGVLLEGRLVFIRKE